jgi:hypothetical protein
MFKIYHVTAVVNLTHFRTIQIKICVRDFARPPKITTDHRVIPKCVIWIISFAHTYDLSVYLWGNALWDFVIEQLSYTSITPQECIVACVYWLYTIFSITYILFLYHATDEAKYCVHGLFLVIAITILY